MDASPETTVIVNPKSGQLIKPNVRKDLKAKLQNTIGRFDWIHTEGMGDAASITRRELKRGAQWIISIGGDGTLNEVVNGFFQDDRPLNPKACLSFIMTGTGNDFQKTLGCAAGLDNALQRFGSLRETGMDVGRLSFVNHRGSKCTRYFLNIASFGMSGAVDRQINRISMRGLLGGKLAFLLATITTLPLYRNKRVRFVIDGKEEFESKIRLVVVANGKYAGGGMLFAPMAETDDGLFDIVVLGDISTKEAIRHMPKIYKGEHLAVKQVIHRRGKKLEAFSNEEVLLDIDGEAPGRLPAAFELLPGALTVKY